MPPSIAAADESLTAWRAGLWRWRPPAGNTLLAGITDRTGDLEMLRAQLASASVLVQTEQVHGASLAAVDLSTSQRLESSTSALPSLTIPGCDGLCTQTPGVALIVRTADCLPITVWDPLGRVVAIIHAGWRGLSRRLPERLLRLLHVRYHCRPERLWVGIGPAIRECCFEVGPEFAGRFAGFVHRDGSRRTCNLIGYAIRQLAGIGVRPSRIADSGLCTACDPSRWHSHRRDGASGGRLFSVALLRP
ncbi:MAG: polyphenol oxidase family protein [Candidatus Omnitrophica bacterium]|nr:polyphenol oxidase family protein [Candidatus Omnitrophota bacterium]